MKIYFDTEFTGLQKDTTLISIGCIDENERSFYAELTDYDKKQVNDWIRDNVIANLFLDKNSVKIEEATDDKPESWLISGNKKMVAKAFKEWLEEYQDVQFVSDVCHYDMVLLIDLFGSAFDLPDGVSAVCHDINQDIASHYNMTDAEAFDASREELLETTIEGAKHNSLYDAKVIKGLYDQMFS